MRFLADENFDGRILRGIRRENAQVDIVRVQDTIIYQVNDPTVLEWAAEENRILLTHDISTHLFLLLCHPLLSFWLLRDAKSLFGLPSFVSNWL